MCLHLAVVSYAAQTHPAAVTLAHTLLQPPIDASHAPQPHPHAPQVRGSIPLLWTQLPNIKYKPPTKINLDHNSAGAFDKHMQALVENYKEVIAINLVGGKGG
jgi:hypothetical protein